MAEGESDNEDKTEAPSQKKLDDALQEGNVPRSIELGTWFVFFGLALAISVMGANAQILSQVLSGMLARPHEMAVDAAGLSQIVTHLAAVVGSALAWPLVLIAAAALFGSMIQHQIAVTLKSVAPQLSRVSPLSGFKRIFGSEALINFVKTILKFIVVAVTLIIVMWPHRREMPQLLTFDPITIAHIIHADLLSVMIAVVIAFGVIAGGDYLVQRLRWYNKLKMTRHDLKEEYKQQEGSPEIKQRIRQLRRKLAKQSMAQRVPKATLVVANPTHFAVALQYEEGMRAPLCLAKGVDHLALKIRKLAEESGVPVIEDPPLARALHRLVEIDDEIPLELYKPVAEIIGYVMRLNRSRSRPDARRPAQ